MNNLPNNESVALPKDLYVLNALAMGVAIQLLARVTGEKIEDWKEYVNAEASRQYKQLSNQEIQKIIDSLEAITAR